MDQLCSGNNPQLDILKAKLSHLKVQISAPENAPKNKLEYTDVVEILHEEIASLKAQTDFESSLKQKLLAEDAKLSRYIEEEENILKCVDKYLEKNSKSNESILEERNELNFQLELLHRKLVALIRKFCKRYFPPRQFYDNDDYCDTTHLNADGTRKPQKSLLDILTALIIELAYNKGIKDAEDVLFIDDTVWSGYINMLICANIVEKCPDDSNYLQLKLK